MAESDVSGAPTPTLRQRIDFVLTDGVERTPAEIGRLLRIEDRGRRVVSHTVRRMVAEGELATRGDGYYFATEATRRKLNARRVRRGPSPRPVTAPVERHLVHLHKRGLRPQTIAQRRWVLSRLEVWLRAQGVELLDATYEQLETFASFASGQAGRKVAVRNIGGFFRWAVEYEGAIEKNPARLLVLPRERPGLPRPIAEEDLARAVELAPEPIRTMLVLAGWCGLRCMEIAALHEHDIDLEARTLIVRDGKGGLPRVQPLPALAADAVSVHIGHGWLFPRVDPPAGPISANDLSQRGNGFLRRAGIPATMHQLRHRYASRCYELSGFDLLATQKLLGHRSIVSTQVYARARPADELHDVVAQL